MKTNNPITTKRVFSKRVAIELRNRGYRIIRTEINKNYPELDVYVFEYTDDIESEIHKISSSYYHR